MRASLITLMFSLMLLGCDVQTESAGFGFQKNADGSAAEGSEIKQTGTEVGNGSPHADSRHEDDGHIGGTNAENAKKQSSPDPKIEGNDEIDSEGVDVPTHVGGINRAPTDTAAPQGGGAATSKSTPRADYIKKVYTELFGASVQANSAGTTISAKTAAEACTKVKSQYVAGLDDNKDGMLSAVEQKSIIAALRSMLAPGEQSPESCK